MKKILSFLMALAMLLSLSAFAGAQAPALSGEINFLSGETDEEQVVVTRAFIEEFEKQNPGCKVNLVLAGMDDREEAILADLYAGAPVDLITVDVESIGLYAKAGVLHELDDVIKDIGEDDFFPGSRVIIDGHDYGFPYAGCSIQMFIRKDLMEQFNVKVPTTWNELLAVAKTFKDNGYYGATLPAGQNNATTLYMNMFINMAGGNVCDENLQPSLNTPEVIKALEFYKELAQYCPPGITSYGYGDLITAFNSGNSAITFYQGRVIARLFNEAPDLLEKYEIHEVPMDETGSHTQFGSYNYYALGKNTKNPELAKAFLKFMCTGENAAKFALTAAGHITPTLESVKELLTSIINSSTDPLITSSADKILASYDHAISDKIFNESANAGGVKGTTFENNGILNTTYGYVRQHNILSDMVQQVLINGVSPADAAAAAQARFVEVLEDQN